MVLDRNSRLVRFSYMFHPRTLHRDPVTGRWRDEISNVPFRTSICMFFWRTFVFIPILLVWVTTIVVYLSFLLGRWMWRDPISWALMIGCILAVGGLMWFSKWASVNWYESHKGRSNPTLRKMTASVAQTWGVFWAGVKAVKGKVCPIIELK